MRARPSLHRGFSAAVALAFFLLLATREARTQEDLSRELRRVEHLRRNEDWTNAIAGYERLSRLAEQRHAPASFQNLLLAHQTLCEDNPGIVEAAIRRIRSSSAPNADSLASHLTVYLAFIRAQPDSFGRHDPALGRALLTQARKLRADSKPSAEEAWLETATELRLARALDVEDAQLRVATKLADQVQDDPDATGGEKARWIVDAAVTLADADECTPLERAIADATRCLLHSPKHPDRTRIERGIEDLKYKLAFRQGHFAKALVHLDKAGYENRTLYGIQRALCIRGLGTIRDSAHAREVTSLCKDVLLDRGRSLGFRDFGCAAIVAHEAGDAALGLQLASRAIDHYVESQVTNVFLSSPRQRYRALFRSRLQNIVGAYGDVHLVARFCHSLRGIVDRSLKVEIAYAWEEGARNAPTRAAEIARLNTMGVITDTTPESLRRLNAGLLARAHARNSIDDMQPCANLGPDELLLQFIDYRPPSESGAGTNSAYAVMVADKFSARIERPGAAFVEFIRRYRLAAESKGGTWQDVVRFADAALAITGPIDRFRKIFVVADGPISAVGWGSLPLGSSGYWSDNREIVCMASLAFLGYHEASPEAAPSAAGVRQFVRFIPPDSSPVRIRSHGAESLPEMQFGPLPRLSSTLARFATAPSALADPPAHSLDPLFHPRGSELVILLAHGTTLKSRRADLQDFSPTALVIPNPRDPNATVVTPFDLVEMGRCTAQRVLLAACWAARDDYLPGSDPVALPWSLIACGAQSVISPAWPIDDRAAAEYLGQVLACTLDSRVSWSKAHSEFLKGKVVADEYAKLQLHRLHGAWQERR